MKLYNPLGHDFTITYDINEDGNPPTFTLHAQEIESFAKPVAEHIKRHLAHEIAMANRGKGTYEDAYEKAVKEIEVEDNG